MGNFFLCTYVLSGCDTVWSFPFRKGKTYVFKTCLKYANDPKLQSILNFPLDNSFDTAEFENSARYFFKVLYGRPFFIGNLDNLRAHLFHTCKSDIRNLPPTEDSFHLHILRAAYQIIIWKTASCVNPVLPNPKDFGWVSKDNIFGTKTYEKCPSKCNAWKHIL